MQTIVIVNQWWDSVALVYTNGLQIKINGISKSHLEENENIVGDRLEWEKP